MSKKENTDFRADQTTKYAPAKPFSGDCPVGTNYSANSKEFFVIVYKGGTPPDSFKINASQIERAKTRERIQRLLSE